MKIIPFPKGVGEKIVPDTVPVFEEDSGMLRVDYSLLDLFSKKGNREGEDYALRNISVLIREELRIRGFPTHIDGGRDNWLCIDRICQKGHVIWRNNYRDTINAEHYIDLWISLPTGVRLILSELATRGMKLPTKVLVSQP